MTKEELVTRLLSIDKQISTRSWITAGGDLGELIDELREEINREPSLLSNFDKAAENYYENDCPYDGEARVVNREYDIWFPSQAIEDAFKAGAEWMSNQLKQGMNEENILVPKFVLESIENTLRIQYNINVGRSETCQGRNIKESLNQVRKLLAGEEVTGMERLEPLYK